MPELDWPLMKRITARILAQVSGVCRVAYDLTPQARGHHRMGVSLVDEPPSAGTCER